MGDVIKLDNREYIAQCPVCGECEWLLLVERPDATPLLQGVECCDCEHRLELDIS